ncbi:protein of unknown function (DUF3524) [Popillia japonica]|uniref:tRNA-queuosine alpha-mannosyltransferase n=1 Tax=Popillia japonica TaxID=7064 RepID=A0AAW1LE41_POPJA
MSPMFVNTDITNPTIVTLKPKKWHWRARCSALILTSRIPLVTTEQVLFISSVVNLAELLGIRPDLQGLKKIVYFHENQLVYPVKIIKERDIQYAYNQIVTCLAADVVIFNSVFNKESFLSNIATIIKLLPDYKPKNLEFDIRLKSKVLYFPLDFSTIPSSNEVANILTIVWPHRLKENNKKFLVSVLGEMFTDVPGIFATAQEHFHAEIINFGFVESREEYLKILSKSQVVISTADHEFFGVSMLEATYAGCFPLLPNKLVYPEIYPVQCLYDTEEELYIKLCRYCDDPALAQLNRRELNIDFDLYSIEKLLPQYLELFSIK